MSADVAYLLFGAALLIAVVLPIALQHIPPSAPVVLLGVGCVIGLLPLAGKKQFSPLEHESVAEHLAELTVIVSLMGVGLVFAAPTFFAEAIGPWLASSVLGKIAIGAAVGFRMAGSPCDDPAA